MDQRESHIKGLCLGYVAFNFNFVPFLKYLRHLHFNTTTYFKNNPVEVVHSVM